MVTTKRERYLLGAAIVVVLVLIVDHYALTPLLEGRDRMRAEEQALCVEMEKAVALFERSNVTAGRWDRMTSGGLKEGAAQAESVVLHALRNWSEESRLDLSSLKPERAAQEGRLPSITVHAVGAGPMGAVSAFLWRVETSPLPLKIEEMQLSSRKDGVDDLSIQLRISALYLPKGTQDAQGENP